MLRIVRSSGTHERSGLGLSQLAIDSGRHENSGVETRSRWSVDKLSGESHLVSIVFHPLVIASSSPCTLN